MMENRNVLNEILDHEKHNQGVSLELLGPSVVIVDRIAQLYIYLSHQMPNNKGNVISEKYLLPSWFMLNAKNQLLISSSLLVKGYFESAYKETRVAIEMAAIAYRIKTDKRCHEIWLQYMKDKDSYEKFRDIFHESKIFCRNVKDCKRTDQIKKLHKLDERFKFCSRFAHVNPQSMAARMLFEDDSEFFKFTATVTSVNNEDQLQLILHWLWTMGTHMHVVDFFASMLSEFIKDQVEWNSKLSVVTEILNCHKNKWEDQIV